LYERLEQRDPWLLLSETFSPLLDAQQKHLASRAHLSVAFLLDSHDFPIYFSVFETFFLVPFSFSSEAPL
jgi:hypothetical protein